MHGQAADEPIATYAGASLGLVGRTYPHSDERGSIVAIYNFDGSLNAINRYDEYGKPAASNVGRFQYTGQKWLSEIGAYDYKARVYLPHLGIFGQTDPIGTAGGINLYAYVGDDPVNAVDPLGLQACEGCPQPIVVPTEIIVTARLPPRILDPWASQTQTALDLALAVNQSITPQLFGMAPNFMPPPQLFNFPDARQQSQTCGQEPFSSALSNPRAQSRIDGALAKAISTPNLGLGQDIPSNGSEFGFDVLQFGPLGPYVTGTYTDYREHLVYPQSSLLTPFATSRLFIHIHQSPLALPGLSPADLNIGIDVVAVDRKKTSYCARGK